MPWYKEYADAVASAYIQKKHVENSFVHALPILYALGLQGKENMMKLGQPKTGVIFGGHSMGKAEMMTTLGSTRHEFKYVKRVPDDGAKVQDRDTNTPTASEFAEDLVGVAYTRWSHQQNPCKVGTAEADAAQGQFQELALLEFALDITWNQAISDFADDLYNGTMTDAQQISGDLMWPNQLGILHALTSAKTYYAGVDRTDKPALTPLEINAATDLDSTIVDLDLISKINTGLTRSTSGVEVEGLQFKNRNNAGATIHLVNPTLFGKLRFDAMGRYNVIQNGGIPNRPFAGIKTPMIEMDNSIILPDRSVPSGTMLSLDPETWLIEFSPQYNFKWYGWQDSELLEGGKRYKYNKLMIQPRVTCRRPDLNCRTYGLAAR